MSGQGRSPRLSVLLPCRDGGSCLAEAIASLEAQTWRDFDVIAVDDGSADDSPRVLADWAARDARVRVLCTPPRGIVAALQAALAGAGGELIARMDADDVAHARRFEKQVAYLDAHGAVSACGTGIRYFPRARVRDGARRYEAWINGLIEPAQIARDVFVECPLPHPTLMIRRTALDDAGGYRDPGWPEDYDLVLRLRVAGHTLGKVPDVLLDWREREDRLSRVDARYSDAAFRRCKAYWLARSLLRGFERVVVWGAGPLGKAFARELAGLHVDIAAFVDLDARKIGQTIHGAPVIEPARITEHRGAFVVAAVGSDAARAEIRAALVRAGWREMHDFCAVA